MKEIKTVCTPHLDEGIKEIEVIKWLKQIGEHVEENESVVIVLNDKATMELPSPSSGKLIRQHYQVGDQAISGNPIYDIEVSKQANQCIKNSPDKMCLSLPSTRQLAKKLGIDINQVCGTGKDGRVTDEDIQSYQAEFSTSHLMNKNIQTQEKIPLKQLDVLMGRKMSASKKNIPHFSYFEQVDATQLVEQRLKLKMAYAQECYSITYMPFIIKALSLTISKYPILNSSLDINTNTLLINQGHHIGIAVKTPLGLAVPILRDVQNLKLKEVIEKYASLIDKMRSNKLSPSDMTGGTITISNFGALGNGLWATPIINFPEVAILSIAKIQKLPFIKDGQLCACDVLNLSWSFDHRVIDGEKAVLISSYFSNLIFNAYQI